MTTTTHDTDRLPTDRLPIVAGSTPTTGSFLSPAGRAIARLAGARVLVLNWRDVRHPQAGGAETYIHEIARRWVAAGVHVTFLTARPDGQPARETIDGIEIHRMGGALGVYARAGMRMFAAGHRYDVIVDCQNGIPFFSPLFVANVPVVQVVHHVHQDQFGTHFSPAMAAVGRVLEAKGATWVYSRHRSVAVSASTRQEMRRRLGVEGIIDIVPNGGADTRSAQADRALDPTIVLVTRMVPHKRVDDLLRALAEIRAEIPDLRVEIVGGGPMLEQLRELTMQLGLGLVVTFHGRVSDAERDRLLSAAWLTTSTSLGEGWGCSVLEAAAMGVPCVAVKVPGIRDSVIDGQTGWLVDSPCSSPADFGAALVAAVAELDDPARAERFARDCRRWAGRFTWDRSAELLAASVVSTMGREGVMSRRRRRRSRSDMTTLAWFTHADPRFAVASLRITDEVHVRGTRIAAILRGCDDVDALALLERIGARDVTVRTARRHEVLAGPDVADDPALAQHRGVFR
jgi:glycosyltransferase involved in cell wall biosynthesis